MSSRTEQHQTLYMATLCGQVGADQPTERKSAQKHSRAGAQKRIQTLP
jgi:hypothetical protein